MDAKLDTWGRRVKAKWGGRPPALWLFTDAARMADPLRLVARLPRGRCGVVLRPGHRDDQSELWMRVARACRERRLALSVAGDWRLAARLHAGLHLRGGRLPGCAPRYLRRATASAHGPGEILRARGAGAALIFISPLFSTASHPAATRLGPARWRRLAAAAIPRAAALGGIDASTIAAVPRRCRAIGAIGAFLP